MIKTLTAILFVFIAYTASAVEISFVTSNSVRVRSAPASVAGSRILGELSLNDQVTVISPEIVYDNIFLEIKILKTKNSIFSSDRYFISRDFLASKIVDYKDFTGKHFIVVNIATETLRLYERQCSDNSCPHKMIMETEVVVGEDQDLKKEEKGKGRSILGSYRVTGWSKFYQDPEAHYPSWYKDGYPTVPKPDAKWNAWFKNDVMPIGPDGKAQGAMRGAFGWYTAFVEPEAYGQWTHGTLGWGADKDKFIQRVKKPLINVVIDPRSSGCTRNNNEAIAYLRYMIDTGTPIIKIYAVEELLDKSLSNYPHENEEWNYVLTKNKLHTVDLNLVAKSLGVTVSEIAQYGELKNYGNEILIDPASPLNQILEVGTYVKDTRPDVIKWTKHKIKFLRKTGRDGNVYALKEKHMHGVYYIDAGMLENYSHPEDKVEVSGFMDEMTPSWMNSRNLYR